MSVDRNDLAPEIKNVIRAHVEVGGWKLEAVPGEPNKTRLGYMMLPDLKGSIPGFVLKQANKDIGYQIVNMRKTVEKFLKEQNY
jgi:hypothetical protein